MTLYGDVSIWLKFHASCFGMMVAIGRVRVSLDPDEFRSEQ